MIKKMNDVGVTWISCFCIPAIFIIGIILGVTIDYNIEGQLSFSNWISAIATAFIAFLTSILAIETWRLRNIQQKQIDELRRETIKPDVILYMEPSEISFQYYDVYIENIGNGIAKDINFKVKAERGAESTNSHLLELFNRLNMIKNGIGSLAPSKKRKSSLINFISISDNIFESCILFNITYKNAQMEEYHSTIEIDFSEYKGITKIGKAPLKELSNEIKEIRNALKEKIAVDVYLAPDREKELSENKKWERSLPFK